MFPEPLTVARPQAMWSGVQFPAELRDFSLLKNAPSRSRPTPPACLLVSGYCKLHNCGVAGERSWPHTSSAKFKNKWSHTSTFPVCSYGKGRNNFTFFTIYL